MFDRLIQSPESAVEFLPMNLRDIIFNPLPHRNENCDVIYSHIGNEFIAISLQALRKITLAVSERMRSLGLKRGDTIMLASFSCSNELGNALIFAGAVCSGIRVFVPIFPEPDEFEYWLGQVDFSCVIMPFKEIRQLKGHEGEKKVVEALENKCHQSHIPFLDAGTDFSMNALIRESILDSATRLPVSFPYGDISDGTEAVIFTTSGSSGRSRMVVYTHGGLANCCQAWQASRLFQRKMFGNPGFSPLFTHTIGIRTFINSIWSGHPFCMVVTDWFLHKPEIVRYLLMQMKPGHLIAGPAFYNSLLELFRQFPELKTGMNKTLQSAISIGARYDESTAMKFRSATGINLMNAFGTSETLMVTLNKQEPGAPPGSRNLGVLLPGVTFGLNRTSEDAVYELFIHSAFQASRIIGESVTSEFIGTGDLVAYEENTGDLFFLNRKSADFIKDEYGVKIPLTALKNYYGRLYEMASWIEWIPMVNIPGLAALIFLPPSNPENRQKELAAMIKNINEGLKQKIEPFEYSHRHIERFSLLFEEVPLTRKGTVSRDALFKKHEQIIAELRNPFVFNQTIEMTETGDKSALFKFSNPHLAEMLEALKADKSYIRAEGDFLYYQDGDNLQRVTDFVGGFGANLVGHNHPILRDAITRFLDSQYPALNNQGSQYHYPALLARELNRIFGQATGKYFKVQFGNSGTEATEIAMHHAYFEWRQRIEKIRDEQFQLYGAITGLKVSEVWQKNMERLEQATPCLVVVNDCFHGYSSGARSLLADKNPRKFFSGLLRTETIHLNDTDADWQDQAVRFIREQTLDLEIFRMKEGNYVRETVKTSRIIASILEPVRGEGGICETNPELAEFLARQEFPLISDEIQCGLGRTGSFPSCPNASYFLLGKSLGGGFEKISAVLIDDNRYRSSFAKYYNSTFANGELAAFIALTTLHIIEGSDLVQTALEKGELFLNQLRIVAAKYPDVIESVNGKGLMIGIQFNPAVGESNTFLRVLMEREVMGYFLAGWLLNEHHIRVLPSLSKPNTLRIEPSCLLPETEIRRFCEALEELCTLCSGKKLYQLCKYLMNGDPWPDRENPVFSGEFPPVFEEPEPGAIRVGFIGNFTLPHRELQILEPDLRQASDTGLRILFNRMQVLLEGKPIRVLGKNLLNGLVHFTFYTLPFDTAQLEVISRWGKKRFYIAKVQEAVDACVREGAVTVSLGAHTSIITGNGLYVSEWGNCRVLSGNSLTVASCLVQLDQYLGSGPDLAGTHTIAVVGASGNIGSGLVECLENPIYANHDFILIGNNQKRLQRMKDKLFPGEDRVSCTTDLDELLRADILICCANTNDPILFPHHIRADIPVYVIDISVPNAVSEAVKNMGNVQFCKEASSVFLPEDPDLLISTHTPKGKIFCCAAEAILCALYDIEVPLKGHIHKDAVQKLITLARARGFFNPVRHESTV